MFYLLYVALIVYSVMSYYWYSSRQQPLSLIILYLCSQAGDYTCLLLFRNTSTSLSNVIWINREIVINLATRVLLQPRYYTSRTLNVDISTFSPTSIRNLFQPLSLCLKIRHIAPERCPCRGKSFGMNLRSITYMTHVFPLYPNWNKSLVFIKFRPTCPRA